MRLLFSDLNGQHGTHQVHFYQVPAGGTFHATTAARAGGFLRRLFTRRRKPEGHGRVQPGLPIDMIGGGYNPPYYPTSIRRQ